MLAPPIYVVGSDILGASLHTSGSALARTMGQYYLNRFSNSLTANSLGWKNPLADVPITDGYIEGRRTWNRQSLYLKSQDGAMVCHSN